MKSDTKTTLLTVFMIALLAYTIPTCIGTFSAAHLRMGASYCRNH